MDGNSLDTRSTGVAPDPAAQVEQVEDRDALLSALGQVPLKQRAALVLRYYAGYTDKELATILGCPAGTVRWRLHAGLRALRRVIQNETPWLLTADDHPLRLVAHLEREQYDGATGL
jgi:DNA-directed RNA polymerase specialized sigma24 family protein